MQLEQSIEKTQISSTVDCKRTYSPQILFVHHPPARPGKIYCLAFHSPDAGSLFVLCPCCIISLSYILLIIGIYRILFCHHDKISIVIVKTFIIIIWFHQDYSLPMMTVIHDKKTSKKIRVTEVWTMSLQHCNIWK